MLSFAKRSIWIQTMKRFNKTGLHPDKTNIQIKLTIIECYYPSSQKWDSKMADEPFHWSWEECNFIHFKTRGHQIKIICLISFLCIKVGLGLRVSVECCDHYHDYCYRPTPVRNHLHKSNTNERYSTSEIRLTYHLIYYSLIAYTHQK